MTVLTNGPGELGLRTARALLTEGRSALDAVEGGIRVVEADPAIHSVGLGGLPNLIGQAECDAAIMDGTTRRAGAVASLQGYLHAISASRQVMERLPHGILVGAGAGTFAREIGLEPADMLTPSAREEHERWLRRHVPESAQNNWPDVSLCTHAWTSARTVRQRGTTVFIAIDADNRLAVGASSSGLAGKYPGRVGDSAIVGAGLYAESPWGACACTHTGEMTIRALTARLVVTCLKRGASVENACGEAISDLRSLRGGLLGPVVVHAVDRCGAPCVAATEAPDPGVTYMWWSKETGEITQGTPVVVS
jgi:beta-aspartyl-peptidase (threonine type)